MQKVREFYADVKTNRIASNKTRLTLLTAGSLTLSFLFGSAFDFNKSIDYSVKDPSRPSVALEYGSENSQGSFGNRVNTDNPNPSPTPFVAPLPSSLNTETTNPLGLSSPTPTYMSVIPQTTTPTLTPEPNPGLELVLIEPDEIEIVPSSDISNYGDNFGNAKIAYEAGFLVGIPKEIFFPRNYSLEEIQKFDPKSTKTNQNSVFSCYPTMDPTKKVYGFGTEITYMGYNVHNAIDYYDDLGSPIFSVLPGKVVEIGCYRCDIDPNGFDSNNKTLWPSAGYGRGITVTLEHEMQDGSHMYSNYTHLSNYHVEVGQDVGACQHIGDMGSTGWVYPKTYYHIHFEVSKNNPWNNELLAQWMDPGIFLSGN